MDRHPPQAPERQVSPWDLRRLYNEGDIKTLAKQGKFTVKIKERKPITTSGRIPIGSKSFETFYFDAVTSIQIARFHHYEKPHGGMIGRFDPKFLRIGGVEYHLPKKGSAQPPRLTNAEINRVLGKSGLQASATYLYYLSEQARKLWKEQVTNRLVMLGLKEGRDILLISRLGLCSTMA